MHRRGPVNASDSGFLHSCVRFSFSLPRVHLNLITKTVGAQGASLRCLHRILSQRATHMQSAFANMLSQVMPCFHGTCFMKAKQTSWQLIAASGGQITERSFITFCEQLRHPCLFFVLRTYGATIERCFLSCNQRRQFHHHCCSESTFSQHRDRGSQKNWHPDSGIAECFLSNYNRKDVQSLVLDFFDLTCFIDQAIFPAL